MAAVDFLPNLQPAPVISHHSHTHTHLTLAASTSVHSRCDGSTHARQCLFLSSRLTSPIPDSRVVAVCWRPCVEVVLIQPTTTNHVQMAAPSEELCRPLVMAGLPAAVDSVMIVDRVSTNSWTGSVHNERTPTSYPDIPKPTFIPQRDSSLTGCTDMTKNKSTDNRISQLQCSNVSQMKTVSNYQYRYFHRRDCSRIKLMQERLKPDLKSLKCKSYNVL